MGVTVNWKPVQDATGYVLYRNAGSKVDLAALPADKVELAPDQQSYVYPMSVNNTVYYIVVGAAKADGTVTFSDQIQIGYYPDTGPGPTKLLRGDWTFGYFGEVAVSELLTNQDIYAAMLTAVGANAIAPTSTVIGVYHKCIVGGRIVFIPDNVYSTAGYAPTSLINSKVIMPAGDYDINGILANKNGYDYVARLAHATTGDVTAALANPNDIYASELGMLFALFGSASVLPTVPPTPGATSFAKYRLNDLATNGWTNVPWSTGRYTSVGRYFVATINSNTVVAEAGTNGKVLLVLELLF